MKRIHDSSRRARVREPVQVYLDRADQSRLERLAHQLDATKSEILRRGLEALERSVTDPAEHPMLRMIGIAGPDVGPPVDYDVALEHDRYLADTEIASWAGPRRSRKRAR